MESMDYRKERRNLLQRARNGALVFYVCTFATILNAILHYVNFPVMMPVGLHTTQYWLIEHCADIHLPAVLGVVLTVLVAAAISVAGYFAREKRRYWVYSGCTAVFALDVLNIFAPQAQLAIGTTTDIMGTYDSAIVLFFDVYAVILLLLGIRALRRVNELDAKIAEEGLTPIDDKDDPLKDMTAAEKHQYEEERRRKKGFFARKQSEQSVVSLDPAAAWPEPAKNPKKAKAERIAQDDAQGDAQEEEQEQ